MERRGWSRVYNNINEIRGVQESLDKFHQNKKVLCKQMAKYINDKRVYWFLLLWRCRITACIWHLSTWPFKANILRRKKRLRRPTIQSINMTLLRSTRQQVCSSVVLEGSSDSFDACCSIPFDNVDIWNWVCDFYSMTMRYLNDGVGCQFFYGQAGRATQSTRVSSPSVYCTVLSEDTE